jgi:hypothetical protein
MMYLLTKKQASFQENTSLQHDKLYFVNLIFYGMNLHWELILSEETTCIEVMFVCGLMYTYNVCDKDNTTMYCKNIKLSQSLIQVKNIHVLQNRYDRHSKKCYILKFFRLLKLILSIIKMRKKSTEL